ncbi:MAG TPA: hypothetical protein VJI52_04510 [Candidatus Nanoarchaeia archaeon]|nr:hypothetical protein [Candidatus Nanoarchaeia archaeon]
MVQILVPGGLPEVKQETLDEILFEFEDEFCFQRACMQVDANGEIGKLIEILRDNPRINVKERETAIRTSVLIVTSIQREGQLYDPNYTLPEITTFTMFDAIKRFRADPEKYCQDVLINMERENNTLYLYVKKQIDFDKAMYMLGRVERFSSVIYWALREQERKIGLGELKKMHYLKSPPYAGASAGKWRFSLG